MNKKNNIGITFIGIMIITIGIQVLTMIKSVFLASQFGVTQSLDSFYLANLFTITVFNIISSAITTVCIPFLSIESDKKKKNRVLSQFITWINIATVIFICLFFILLVLFVDQIGYSFNEQNKYSFLMISAILFLGQLFRVGTAFSTAILQTENHFYFVKIAMLASNLIPVIYLIMFENTSLVILTWCIVLGYVIECIITYVVRIRNKNFFLKPTLSKIDDQTKKMILNSFPIMLSSTVFQLQLIFSNYIIGIFGEGFISILSNTNQIVGIFQILFVSNLVTILYPKIAKDVKYGVENGLKKLTTYISATNIIIVLLVWGYISLGNDLIEMLFVRGEFTIENAKTVYSYGVFLMLSLPISVIRDYVYRLLYSLDKVSIPTKNAFQTVIVNIVLILLLQFIIGPYSVVVSSLLSTLISTCSILIKLKKIGYSVNIKKILRDLFISNIIGLVMYLCLIIFKISSFALIINFILNMFIGLVIYFFGVLLFYRVFFKEKRHGFL